MLEKILSRSNRRRVFRLAVIPVDLTDELQLDAQSGDELQEVLNAVG